MSFALARIALIACAATAQPGARAITTRTTTIGTRWRMRLGVVD